MNEQIWIKIKIRWLIEKSSTVIDASDIKDNEIILDRMHV